MQDVDTTGFGPSTLRPDRADSTVFVGSGEMANRCRALDWALTPLGPIERWSQSLRAIVSTLLASRHPMFLWWGPELVQIYNDAYRPSLGEGGRHPRALGMRCAEFWTEIWPVIGPQIDGVMTRGEATWHEDQLVPIERNGRLEEVYWTYGYSPVRDDDGTIGGTLVVCTETTQRVQLIAAQRRSAAAEREARSDAERARALLDRVFSQSPVAIAVFEGRDLHFTVANPRYRQIIGDRDPVGRTMVEVFPDLAGSDVERTLQNVYDTATPFVVADHLVRFDSRGTGEMDNYYDAVYHPLTDEAGTVSGIVAIVVDVTDHRAALLERERLLGLADQANRAKSDFLAVMSHELRTPLNAIGGYTELLELGIYGGVTVEQRTALDRIQRSQRHLLGLIDGVLNYAKLEAGAVHYTVRDVAIGELLTTCEALTVLQARTRGVALTITGSDPALHVRADAEKLQQIMLNMLTNAIKFTDAPGQVTMTCLVDAADGRDEICVSVADTGAGIAPEHLAEVFDPFVQVSADLTRTTQGVGLGLAISRNLARGMGGDLTVESVVGVGSTFTLRLPRAGC
jgi:signal transduction histidine kinase